MKVLSGIMFTNVNKIEFIKHKKGFTLAEVLVTLVVIGVVAALCIPALIQNTQQAEFKAAWKKDYSVLSQAVLMAQNDNAGDLNSYLNGTSALCPLLSNYLSTTKVCPAVGDTISACFSNPINELNGTHVGGTGDLFSAYRFDDGGMMLANGATLAFENGGGADSYNGVYYAYIWVDVNGNAPPNTIGKDIFGMIILRNSVIPMGTTTAQFPQASDFITLQNEACTPGTTTGMACSTFYLLNN